MNYFYKGVLYDTPLTFFRISLKGSLNICLKVNVCAFLKGKQEGRRGRKRERKRKRERENQKGKKIKHMGTTSKSWWKK